MALTKTYIKSKKAYKVTFSLPSEVAPDSSDVRVVGEFNNWNWDKAIYLKRKKDEFVGALDLTPGKYEFRYLIDLKKWENDWAADAYVAAPYPGIDNSVIELKPSASSRSKASATKAKVDFTIIEGVGPKINQLILEAGIKTFKKLANTKPEKIKTILSEAGNRYKMHDPRTWPKQAAMVVENDLAGLKKYQNKLKGGK